MTVVNTVEPFFAWRSLWVLMEETQHRFYRLRDELTYYIAATPADELDGARLQAMFGEYQQTWNPIGTRWMKYRRAFEPIE